MLDLGLAVVVGLKATLFNTPAGVDELHLTFPAYSTWCREKMRLQADDSRRALSDNAGMATEGSAGLSPPSSRPHHRDHGLGEREGPRVPRRGPFAWNDLSTVPER
jgi:hypothetical protein